MAIELRNLRSINSKTFKNNDDTLITEAHCGHIHYNNKLGVGDGIRGLREINWRLSWDGICKGWYFENHSFQPFIPEYADDWIKFRDLYQGKDQVIRWRALANHVKGRLIDEITEVSAGANAIVYDDAFGIGIDLILCFSRSSFKRIIRIKDGYYPNKDVSFDFEIDIPNDKKLYRGFDTTSSYELDITKSKEFDTGKQTFIGLDQKDGKEWFTYIRPFQIWDSGDKLEKSIVNFVVNSGKTYIRKNIPVSFFANAKGDVFTDDTVSYYSGVGDGWATIENASWDTAHDSSTSDNAIWDTTTIRCMTGEYGGLKIIRRAFMPINTSALPDNSTISDATFYFYIENGGYGLVDDDNDGDDWVNLVQTNQADTSQLSTDDYDQCGDTVDNPTEGGTRVDLGDLTIDQYNSIVLNATGRGWISKTGITKLGMREGHDCIDSPFVGTDESNQIRFYTSEETGLSKDPYISITYTVPGAPAIMTTNTGYWGPTF